MRFAGRSFVLLAGHRVAAAFGVREGYLREFVLQGVPAAVVPHPSGVNRWWNDPANVARASAFLRGVFARLEKGDSR
jgi:hypothetical protein